MPRQYILSERAHLMCPDMHFALCAEIAAAFDEARLADTLAALRRAHPLLGAVAARDDAGKWYYHVRPDAPGYTLMRGAATPLTPGGLWDDYRSAAAGGWDAMRERLLRVLVYPSDGRFTVALIAHHLLCDGRGLLGLAGELANHYAAGEAPRYVEERLLSSLDDLPKGSDLPFVSRLVIKNANKRWAAEGQKVNYADYLAFERRYLRDTPVKYSLDVYSCDRLDGIAADCKRHGVTVNDWLIAKMMREEGADKVVIAADIRARIACYAPGSLGNFSTALSVTSKAKAPDIMQKAVDVSRAVRRKMANNSQLFLVLACYFAMEPGLIDAAAIAALGGFDSKAARFVGGQMFGFAARQGCSVTNLGKFDNPHIASALFIPPASPANRVTSGVLTTNGVMTICTARAGA